MKDLPIEVGSVIRQEIHERIKKLKEYAKDILNDKARLQKRQRAFDESVNELKVLGMFLDESGWNCDDETYNRYIERNAREFLEPTPCNPPRDRV